MPVSQLTLHVVAGIFVEYTNNTRYCYSVTIVEVFSLWKHTTNPYAMQPVHPSIGAIIINHGT